MEYISAIINISAIAKTYAYNRFPHSAWLNLNFKNFFYTIIIAFSVGFGKHVPKVKNIHEKTDSWIKIVIKM